MLIVVNHWLLFSVFTRLDSLRLDGSHVKQRNQKDIWTSIHQIIKSCNENGILVQLPIESPIQSIQIQPQVPYKCSSKMTHQLDALEQTRKIVSKKNYFYNYLKIQTRINKWMLMDINIFNDKWWKGLNILLILMNIMLSMMMRNENKYIDWCCRWYWWMNDIVYHKNKLIKCCRWCWWKWTFSMTSKNHNQLT